MFLHKLTKDQKDDLDYRGILASQERGYLHHIVMHDIRIIGLPGEFRHDEKIADTVKTYGIEYNCTKM
jgi:hypothetical protein